MSDAPSDRTFDDFLTVAMKARPEPDAIPDLSAIAIERAATLALAGAAPQMRGMSRYRWWSRLATVAATFLIALVLVAGAHRLLTDSAKVVTSDGTTLAQLDDASSSSTSAATSASQTHLVLIGELLLAGLALASLGRSGWSGVSPSEALNAGIL